MKHPNKIVKILTVEFLDQNSDCKYVPTQVRKISQRARGPGNGEGLKTTFIRPQATTKYIWRREPAITRRKKPRNTPAGTTRQGMQKTPYSPRRTRNIRKENSALQSKSFQRKLPKKALKRGSSKLPMHQGWKKGRHNWYWSHPVEETRRRRHLFWKEQPARQAQSLPCNRFLEDHFSRQPEALTGFYVFQTRR